MPATCTSSFSSAAMGCGFEPHRPWLLVWYLLALVAGVAAHGRLWEPPSRSSMWRLGYNTSINTDDNELSCGGFANQWIRFGGRCGICGDPYQQRPRDNEYGGKFASGLITRIYPMGGVINVVVDLTANHLGYFEFRLCPINDVTGAEPEHCLDRDRLQIINGDTRGYRFYIRDPTVDGHVTIKARLPQNVYCKHCILQWKYHTGTRWGCDGENRCEKGIGPQEEFYGCSDISIGRVRSTIYRDPDYFAMDNKKTQTSVLHPNVVQPRKFMPIPKHLNLKKVNSGTPLKDSSTGSTLPETKLQGSSKFNRYLHGIIMDAMMKQHKHTEPEVNGFRCKAAPAFATNPIVNEWCLQTCPRNTKMCKPSMCSCKSFNPSIPVPVPAPLRPLPVLCDTRKTVKSLRDAKLAAAGDRMYIFKKLGLDKDEFAAFIRRALETYKSVERNKHGLQNAYHDTHLETSDSQLTAATKLAPQTPGKQRVVFLTMPDRHRSPNEIQRKGRITRITNKRKPILQEFMKVPPRINKKKPILQEFMKVPPRINKKPSHRINPANDVPKNTNKFISSNLNKYAPRKVKLKQQLPSKTGISQFKPYRRSLSNDIYGLEKTEAQHSVEPRTIRCVASVDFSHNKYMNKWCVRNCSFGFCPKSVCMCL